MSVVTLLGEPFSGEREFARRLAQSLNYRCIEPETVIERTALSGGTQQELQDVLEKPPSLSQCLSHSLRVSFRLLQAALAREIRGGNVVCYGNLGRLLPRSNGQIRIRLVQSQHRRVETARAEKRLDHAAAAALVSKSDQDAHAWLRYVYIAKLTDRVREEITARLDCEDVGTACMRAVQAIRERESARSGDTDTTEKDLVASALARAALAVDLATSRLDLDLDTRDGLVCVAGTANIEDLGEIRRVLMQVEGVKAIDVKGIKILTVASTSANALEATQAPIKGRSLRVPMAAAFAAGFAASVLLLGPFRPAGSVRALSGIITDTKCAGNHSLPGIDPTVCIRECIHKGKGVDYALYDGKRLYVLADQTAAANFAGRKVLITSPEVDKESGRLKIHTIKTL